MGMSPNYLGTVYDTEDKIDLEENFLHLGLFYILK